MQNYRNAIKDFNRAIELRPNFAEAYFRKGQCYQELKRDDEALLKSKEEISK